MKVRCLNRLAFIVLSFCISSAVADTYQKPDADSLDYTYEDVGKPTQEGDNSLTLNSNSFIASSPLSVEGTYSSEFGYIISAMYTRMVDVDNAIGLLADYGQQENRMDVTWAHQLTERQRTKISIERLEQELDFSYDSGDVTEWVPQYSAGMAYQYLFEHSWLSDLEVSGYYAAAQSDDLSTVSYTKNNITYNNYRHIAGATSRGSAFTFDLLPWRSAVLGLGLNYDEVVYDNKYNDVSSGDRDGLGFTLNLVQLLTPHLKVDVSASQRETYDTYSGALTFLKRSTASSDIEMGIKGERTIGQDSSPNDTRLSLIMSYYFDDNYQQHVYSLNTDADHSGLLSWASKSLAYMNQVLAASDQKTIAVSMATDDQSMIMLQDADQDSVTLHAGVINSINLQRFIERASIDTDNTSVRLVGGPDNITFNYGSDNQLLVTEQVVPAEDIDQNYAPLIVMFVDNSPDSDTSEADLLRDAGKLVLQIHVDGNSDLVVPYETPLELHVVVGQPYDMTFKLSQLVELDGDDNVYTNPLYINNDFDWKEMLLVNFSGLPAYGLKCEGCHDNPSESQTIRIYGTPTNKFPTNEKKPLVVSMLGCNNNECSATTLKIHFVASGLSITGVDLDQYAAGQAIDDYNFMDNGTVQIAKNASLTSYSVAFYDWDNNSVSAAAVGLDISTINGDKELLLSGAPNSNYADQEKEMHFVLTLEDSNGSTAENSNNPFYFNIQGVAPSVTGVAITDPIARAESVYAGYDFISHADVVIGDGKLDCAHTSLLVSDQQGGPAANNAGFTLTCDADSQQLTLTGTPSEVYVGDTMNIALSVMNTKNDKATTNSTPFTIMIQGAPPVVSGATLPASTVEQTYASYDFVNQGNVSIGSGDIDCDNTALRVYHSTDTSTELNLADTGFVFTCSAQSLVLSGTPSINFVSKTLAMSLTVKNTTTQEIVSNSVASDPYLLDVNAVAPTVSSANIQADLGYPLNGTAITSYNFVSQGQVSPGVPDSIKSMVATFYYVDENGDNQKISSPASNLGLTVNLTGCTSGSSDCSDIQLAGTPTVDHVGQLIKLVLSVTNMGDATGSNSVDNAFSFLLQGKPPEVSGVIITSPSATVGDEYAGYEFVGHGVTIGDGDLDCSVGGTTITVYDADDTLSALPNNGGMALTCNKQSLVLVGVPEAQYADDTFDIVLHVKNKTNYSTISNDIRVDPFVLDIHSQPVPPTVTGVSITDPVATAGEVYAGYDFVSGGDVTLGTGGLVSSCSATFYEGGVQKTDTGFSVACPLNGSAVTLTGTPSSTYENKNIDFSLCVTNTKSSETVCNDVSSNPFSIVIEESNEPVIATLACPVATDPNIQSSAKTVYNTDSEDMTFNFAWQKGSGFSVHFTEARLTTNGSGQNVLQCLYEDWMTAPYQIDLDPAAHALPASVNMVGGDWSGTRCGNSQLDPGTCQISYEV